MSYLKCIVDAVHAYLDTMVGAGVVDYAIGGVERFTHADAHRVVWTPVSDKFGAPPYPEHITSDGGRRVGALNLHTMQVAAAIWASGADADTRRQNAERLMRNLIVAARFASDDDPDVVADPVPLHGMPVSARWVTDEPTTAGRAVRGAQVVLIVEFETLVLDEVSPLVGDPTGGELTVIDDVAITAATFEDE